MFDIFNMLKKEENAAPKQVTRDTIIGDILDMDQSTAPYFMEIGMHCLGCPAPIWQLRRPECCPHWMRVWRRRQSWCAPGSRWQTSAATTAS